MPEYFPLDDFLLQKDELRRPLDWRHQRGMSLSMLEPRRRIRRAGDDAVVLDYARMLWNLYGSPRRDYYDVDKTAKKFGDIFYAYLRYSTMGSTERAVTEGLLFNADIESNRVTEVSGLDGAQQDVYRKLYLDIEGREDMSMIIAPLILETNRQSISAEDTYSNAERPSVVKRRGSLSPRIETLLRLAGYYAGPVVVELLYSKLLRSAYIPLGGDSAQRWLNSALLGAVRADGYISVMTSEERHRDYVSAVLEMSTRLAFEEKAEKQADTISHITAMLKQMSARIGNPSEFYGDIQLPQETPIGKLELNQIKQCHSPKITKS